MQLRFECLQSGRPLWGFCFHVWPLLWWKMLFSMELEIPLCCGLGMVLSSSVVSLRLQITLLTCFPWPCTSQLLQRINSVLAGSRTPYCSLCLLPTVNYKFTVPIHVQVVCHVSRSFCADLLLSQLVASLYLCVRLFWPRCRTLYLLVLIFIKHCYQSFAPPCKGFSKW